MTDILNRLDLEEAQRLFALSCRAARAHDREAKRALSNYGSHGPAISGCVRDHFPDGTKNMLRELARHVREKSDLAYAARPSRVRVSTMRKLARAVAARDGSGFYGPQP